MIPEVAHDNYLETIVFDQLTHLNQDNSSHHSPFEIRKLIWKASYVYMLEKFRNPDNTIPVSLPYKNPHSSSVINPVFQWY